jgi:hypothetical protein
MGYHITADVLRSESFRIRYEGLLDRESQLMRRRYSQTFGEDLPVDCFKRTLQRFKWVPEEMIDEVGCSPLKKRKPRRHCGEVVANHVVLEEAIPLERIAALEQLLADMLFKGFLKEKGLSV